MGTENTLKVIRIRLLIVFKMPKGSVHPQSLGITHRAAANKMQDHCLEQCAKEIGINDA